MHEIYPPHPETGTIDWLNELHCSYMNGDYQRALVAATAWHGETTEALRLLLLEGAEEAAKNFGKVEPMGEPK